MTDNKTLAESNQNTDEPKESKGSSKPTKTATSLLTKLNAFFILIIAIGVSGLVYFGYQYRQQAQEQLLALDAKHQNALRQIETLKQSLAKIEANHNQIKLVQEQLQYNSERLAAIPGTDRQDWLLAEVEYLLRLANQRAQLERDNKGAIALFEAANQVLAEADNPGLKSVREKVTQDIYLLQKVERVDIDGTFLELANLQKQVDTLEWVPQFESIHKESMAAASSSSSTEQDENNTDQIKESNFWLDMKKQMQQLVIITPREGPIDEPLTPEQHYYVRHNIRLMFEQAQFAVLQGNQKLFDLSLEKSHKWITKYFQVQLRNAQALLKKVEALQAHKVINEQPDVSASLNALKDYQWRNRYRPVVKQQEPNS